MKVSVSVKTNSRIESVEKQPDGTYIVRVRVPPVDGKANERVRELLEEHFGLPKRAIEIISGFKGRKKVFEIKGGTSN